EMLSFYRELIALRAAEPELAAGDLRAVDVDFDEAQRWIRVGRGSFTVVANLSDASRRLPGPGTGGSIVLATSAGVTLTGDGALLDLPARSAVVLRRGGADD